MNKNQTSLKLDLNKYELLNHSVIHKHLYLIFNTVTFHTAKKCAEYFRKNSADYDFRKIIIVDRTNNKSYEF